MTISRFTILLTGAAVLTVPGAAWAQAPTAEAATAVTDDIVVTAQRRQELSRDVPITITTLDADQLAAAGASQLSDIARVTPGIRFDTVTNFIQPTIRGIGTAVNLSGGGSNVGIYVDGFYNTNTLGSNLSLAGVKNVQVLKGPQGTLFGRNTTGGAILVTTADPSVETGGMAEVSLGRFNEQRYRGYVTTGLTSNIAVDLEASYHKGDGFLTNIIDDNDKIGKYKNWYVRTGVKADLSDTVSVLLRYHHTDTNDPSGNMSNPLVDSTGEVMVIEGLKGSGLYSTRPSEVGVDGLHGFTAKTDAIQGTIRAEFGSVDFTSYTQYRHDKTSAYNNFDFTAAPIFTGHLRTRLEAVTQEFLLTSQPGTRLQWSAGLFFFQSSERWDFGIATNPPEIPLLSNNTKTSTYAAYADVAYEVTPSFFVTVGGRFSHDKVQDAWFTSTNPATFGQKFEIPNYSSNHFTPRLVLRYTPTDRSSVYASVAKGYKAGLLNVGGEQFEPVKPEDITAFEVGFKYGDRAFSFDISAFYYKYKDLQVSTYFSNTALVSNAASSRIYGLDAQLAYRFDMGLELNWAAAYTSASYENFDNAATYVRCGPTEPCAGLFRIEPINIVNGQMQRTPEFTANIGARYPIEFSGGSNLMLSGNLYYTTEFFFDSSEQFPQKSYEVLALRAEWTDASDHFSVAVFGDNLTNNRYRTQVFTNDLGIGNSWSAPATYGVSLKAKF